MQPFSDRGEKHSLRAILRPHIRSASVNPTSSNKSTSIQAIPQSNQPSNRDLPTSQPQSNRDLDPVRRRSSVNDAADLRKQISVGSDELVAWKAFVSQGHHGHTNHNRESTLGLPKASTFLDAPQQNSQILPINEHIINDNAMMIVRDNFPHDHM